MTGRRSLLVMLCLLAGGTEVKAQIEWGFNVGRAISTGWPTSRVSTVRLSVVELEASFPAVVRRTWRLELPMGLLLHARLANTALGPAVAVPMYPKGEWRVPTEAGRATATGMGVRPLGLRALRRIGGVELGVEGGVGGVVFNIPAPASNTARFNFTAELGLGLRIPVPRGDVNFTYRAHHLSNGGLGEVNPAVDSHLLLFGISMR